jgi:hypothetical protein
LRPTTRLALTSRPLKRFSAAALDVRAELE